MIVLLTVFRKTRQHDQRPIDRAVQAQQACERDHGPAGQVYEAGVITGYHTRWVLPDAAPEDPERIAIREFVRERRTRRTHGRMVQLPGRSDRTCARLWSADRSLYRAASLAQDR